ncbi:alcohol dehydrogenase [Crepidotus variabilis]|uniref:Alcohol dehydrogenase n=1 Tax=Crepidotus variabilis TaxID=179855 RepID=A0A9P6JQ83_9AGAR|nr:alcohol dehydrogenase [Crepidotus variabilis]
MSPIINGRVIFNSYPKGFPEPGKTLIYDKSSNIDLDNTPLDGGVLVKTLELSIDPYLRHLMEEAPTGYKLGEPTHGGGVAVVLRSESENVQVASWILKNPYKLPWSAFTGVLGMPGLSAYQGWRDFSNAKKGEVAFVTSGAGPVGSLVIQLAKFDGLKVIASAGSEDKVQLMKDLGADVVFNYKRTNTSDVPKKEGPIDVYWDNVGGEVLDDALVNANTFARFIECGMISGYNDNHACGLKNIWQVVVRQISIHGFLVSDKYLVNHEFYKFMEPKIAKGEIKYVEDCFEGLENVGEAISGLQRGLVKAKVVVHVDDVDEA